MCGIHFIFDKHKKLGPEVISTMASLTRYRGPDDTDIKTAYSASHTYHLAANRLKITDPSDAAAQPFADQTHALLFNGEIYNYYELKNELIRKKIIFNSHSDTEVLFHWLKEYGTKEIEKLEGMFAFVFVDFQSDKILIGRDRFGIKPLYYYEDSRYFIASSEIKAVVGSGLIEKKLNTSQINHYLLFKYAKPPGTFFENVYTMPQSCILSYQNKQWKQISIPKNNERFDEGMPDSHTVEDLLKESLLQQLNSNVPIGLLLSGGVDSTLLLALAQREGFTLPSFSIINSKGDSAFGTRDFHYAKLAASTYGSDHTEMLADISLLEKFPEFIAGIDQPIGDSSYLMTHAICREASLSMKILLSGAGADELFAGYNRHWAYYKYLRHQKLFDLLLPPLKKISGFFPTGLPFAYWKKLRLAKKFISSHEKSPYAVFQNFIIFQELGLEDVPKELLDGDDFSFEMSLQHDRDNYLVHDVLALSDRASMHNSIELRVPYLNEKLVSYMNSFPAETRIQNGQKWLLKEILIRNGGKIFAKRAKEGFGLPLSGWLMDKKADHLWEVFEPDSCQLFEYFDRSKFNELVRQQKNG